MVAERWLRLTISLRNAGRLKAIIDDQRHQIQSLEQYITG